MSIVKKQFNSQAKNFHNWSITKNMEYMQRYKDDALFFKRKVFLILGEKTDTG